MTAAVCPYAVCLQYHYYWLKKLSILLLPICLFVCRRGRFCSVKPRIDGETEQPVDAISKVLDEDNLLREIMVHVSFPTTLVCATLVSRRCLGHASDPAFPSCFHKLHPPRLLGYYISECPVSSKKLGSPHLYRCHLSPQRLASSSVTLLTTVLVPMTAVYRSCIARRAPSSLCATKEEQN